jgi:hypothetical protein
MALRQVQQTVYGDYSFNPIFRDPVCSHLEKTTDPRVFSGGQLRGINNRQNEM